MQDVQKELGAYEERIQRTLKPRNVLLGGTVEGFDRPRDLEGGTESGERIAGEAVADAVYPKVEKATIEDKVDAAGLLGHQAEVPIYVEESDVSAAKEKAELTRLKDFNNWIITGYMKGLTTDAKRNWLRTVYPEWFDQQKELIAEIHSNKERFQKILLHGPQSMEELWFLFVIQEEYPFIIETNVLPGGADEDNLGALPTEAESTKEQQAQRFRRGLWPRFREMWNTIGELGKYKGLNPAELVKRHPRLDTDKALIFGANAIDRTPFGNTAKSSYSYGPNSFARDVRRLTYGDWWQSQDDLGKGKAARDLRPQLTSTEIRIAPKPGTSKSEK